MLLKPIKVKGSLIAFLRLVIKRDYQEFNFSEELSSLVKAYCLKFFSRPKIFWKISLFLPQNIQNKQKQEVKMDNTADFQRNVVPDPCSRPDLMKSGIDPQNKRHTPRNSSNEWRIGGNETEKTPMTG